jgi:hypothetical protein
MVVETLLDIVDAVGLALVVEVNLPTISVPT